MTTATATHEVIAPECWLITMNANGFTQHLTDAWFVHESGRWMAQFDITDPMTFATREVAVEAFRTYRLDPRRVKLTHRRAAARMTEAGKADVAARRAARNADRKW